MTKVIRKAAEQALKELGREGRVVAITPAQSQASQWWIDLADEDRRITVNYEAGDTVEAMTAKIKALLQDRQHS